MSEAERYSGAGPAGPVDQSGSASSPSKWTFKEKMVSGLRIVKTKTVDVASTGAKELGSKMPTKEGISQLGRRGKHAVVTSSWIPGKGPHTKASKDVSYELKHRTAHNSLIILSDLYKEFNLFVKHAAAIADRYQAVADLLEKFRQSCDTYIEMETTEAEGYAVSDDEADEGSTQNTKSGEDGAKKRGASPTDINDKAKMPTVSGDAELSSAKTEVIQTSMKKIRDVTDEMRFTLTGSCMSLLSNTMKSLETETTRVQSDVIKASVDYDLTRDSVSKLQAEVDKLKDSLNRSDDHLYALSPQVRASVQEDCDDKERRLQELHHDQDDQREGFQRHMLDGRTDLLFSLEQTSMATWSCFNILFHSMERFFGDIAAASSPAAQAMLTLKNNQTVAKAIDRERKKKLRTARLNSELRAGVAPGSTAVAAATTTSSSSSAGGGDLFGGTMSSSKPTQPGMVVGHASDDLFQDFMDSRKEAIPALPPMPTVSAVSPSAVLPSTGHSDPLGNMPPYAPQPASVGTASSGIMADGLDFFS